MIFDTGQELTPEEDEEISEEHHIWRSQFLPVASNLYERMQNWRSKLKLQDQKSVLELEPLDKDPD